MKIKCQWIYYKDTCWRMCSMSPKPHDLCLFPWKHSSVHVSYELLHMLCLDQVCITFQLHQIKSASNSYYSSAASMANSSQRHPLCKIEYLGTRLLVCQLLSKQSGFDTYIYAWLWETDSKCRFGIGNGLNTGTVYSVLDRVLVLYSSKRGNSSFSVEL